MRVAESQPTTRRLMRLPVGHSRCLIAWMNWQVQLAENTVIRTSPLYAVHVDVPCLGEHTHFRIEVPVCVIWIRITSDLNHLREGVRRCQPFCPTGPGFLSEMTTFTSATNHPERSESNSRPKTFCSMNSRRGATSSPMWTRGVVQEITCAKPRAGAQPLCLVDSRFMSQDSTFMSPTN